MSGSSRGESEKEKKKRESNNWQIPFVLFLCQPESFPLRKENYLLRHQLLPRPCCPRYRHHLQQQYEQYIGGSTTAYIHIHIHTVSIHVISNTKRSILTLVLAHINTEM